RGFECSGRYACTLFFQAEDGIRDRNVTGVQTCALPIFLVEVVDLVGVLAEEAGALHRLGQHQGGGDHRREPGAGGLVDRGVQDQIGRASCRERVERTGGEVGGEESGRGGRGGRSGRRHW